MKEYMTENRMYTKKELEKLIKNGYTYEVAEFAARNPYIIDKVIDILSDKLQLLEHIKKQINE